MSGIFRFKPVLAALAFLNLNSLGAYAFNYALPNSDPWTTRVIGQGLGGTSQLGGFFDGMIPVIGKSDSLWYLDGGISGGQYDNLVGSIGTGARHFFNWKGHDAIFGTFLFGDYQHTRNTNKWIASPGIELMTPHNDFRVSGYFPVGSRHPVYYQTVASLVPQSVLNDSGQSIANLNKATGHRLIDTPVGLTNEYGQGVEAEVGQYIPLFKGGWLRGGVYYFNYQNASNITGVEFNYEFFLNRNSSLILQENYDNQNQNKFSVGLRVRFGGPDATRPTSVAERMEDLVGRHLARPSYGMATPVRNSFVVRGSTQTLADNVWFFSPNGTVQQGPVTLSSCTAEHPCLDLTQTRVNGINAIAPEATLWFAPGTYPLPGSTANNHYVLMADGQSISGRTSDFRGMALGADRALIDGGLWWNGSGQVNNIQINNKNQLIPASITGSTNAVIGLGTSQNLTIKDSLITALSTNGVVVAIYGNGNVNVANSNINSTATSSSYGIVGDNVVVTDSTISALSSEGFAYGVFAYTEANVKNSNINSTNQGLNDALGVYSDNSVLVTNSHLNVSGVGNAWGAYTENNDIIIVQSQINVNSASQATGGRGGNNTFVADTIINATGDVATGLLGANTIVLTNSSISSSPLGNSLDNSIIVWSFNNGNVTLNGSSIFSQGVYSPSRGIVAGSVDFIGSSSTINLNTPNGVLQPTQAIDSPVINNNSSPPSQCIVNGVHTVCG